MKGLSMTMKRKIVRHGPSSLTVSLPIKWAKRNGPEVQEALKKVREALGR